MLAVWLGALSVLLATQGVATDFGLTHVTVPVPVGPDRYRCFVTTTGDAPADSVMSDVRSWHLTAKPAKGNPFEIRLEPPQWDRATKHVTLIFVRRNLANASALSWKVLFTGAAWNVSASSREASGHGLEPAKGKNDADLYVAGAFLTGAHSSPIYALDAKLGWTRELGTTPWDAGVSASASVNQGAVLPVGRSPLDFDAVNVGLVARYWAAALHPALLLDLRPIVGEFTKENAVADAVTAVRLTAYPPPFARNAAVFYPFLGWELGLPIVKSDTVLGQAVDLSRWRYISRFVIGATTHYYLFGAAPTSDNLYSLALGASYVARMPMTDEPFAALEQVAGTATTVTRLRRNIRQEAEAEALWNFSSYVGLQVQYKYGSLPPLFRFVDHQINIGLTFKAKYASNRPALF